MTFSRSQGQSRRFGDVCDVSALPPTTAVMMQCRERQKGADFVEKVVDDLWEQ
jgi:hypothetical protein